MKRRFFSVLMTMFITIISLNGCNTNKEIKDDEQNQAKQEIQLDNGACINEISGGYNILSIKEKIDLINDAYCPSQPIDLIKSNHDIGLIHGMVNTEVIIKDNISLNDDKEKIGSIIMTSGSPVVTDKSVENDKIKLDGVVKVSVLYRTADEISRINMCTGEVPFTTVIDLKGTNKDMDVVSKVQIESIDSTIEANTIGIRITLSAWAKVSYKVNKEWIVDVVESENGLAESKASVTIYSVDKGDTLWNLAKKYNTTIEELVKINDIEDPDVIIVGQKLIIPGRAVF